MSRLVALLALWALACGDTVVVVEVDLRGDLGELTSLEVTAINDGETISESFDLTGQSFPVTFTITAAGRDGEIQVELLALDSAGIARGAGLARGTLSDGNSRRLSARLDPADFVVNTLTEGAQRPVFRPGRYGKQITATDDGGFAVAFVNDCQNPALCDVFVRRFDADARPVTLAGSSDERAINSGSYPEVSVPAIASPGGVNLAVIWEISTAVVLAELGDSGQVITPDTNTSDPEALDPVDPAITALATGQVVLTWTQERIDVDNPAGVWQSVGTGAPVLIRDEATAATPSIATSGTDVATAWSEGANLMLSIAPPGQAGTPLAAKTFGETARVLTPNITAFGNELLVGYGVVDGGAGELLVSRFDGGGSPSAEVIIGPAGTTDTVSLAVGDDGLIAAVWQGCDDLGDEDGCGIFMSLFDADLAPLADPIRINTTTAGDQLAPSVAPITGGFAAVWTDLSGEVPDTSSAVRARPIYLDSLDL